MSQLRIAIVGGGPGGLTLARILHLRGVEADVFEREQFSAARPQGGSLDMHEQSGQHAIARAGLSAEFATIARYEDQQSRVYDKHGTLCFLDTNTTQANRPEVDRGQLRDMLLRSLPDGTVRWNRSVRAIEPAGDKMTVAFSDGTHDEFDLVVGADGTWSSVRPLLSEARPVYSGITMIEIGIDDVDVRYPDTASLVGHGLTFALGDGKAIIGHRDAGAHVGGYIGLRLPEEWAQTGIDASTPDAFRETLGAYFGDWSRDLGALIARCDDRITPRRIYAMPVGHRWTHRAGLTMLGDAAHVMSPFGGDGANLAMLDAVDLADAIASESDRDGAIARYESVMAARAEIAAAGARDGIEEAFSEDALAHTVAHMRELRGQG